MYNNSLDVLLYLFHVEQSERVEHVKQLHEIFLFVPRGTCGTSGTSVTIFNFIFVHGICSTWNNFKF